MPGLLSDIGAIASIIDLTLLSMIAFFEWNKKLNGECHRILWFDHIKNSLLKMKGFLSNCNGRNEYKIKHIIDIYKDESCTNLIMSYKGLLISCKNKKSGQETLQVHPVYKLDESFYQKNQGEKVTFSPIMGNDCLGKTWYKDPETNEVKPALDDSLIFKLKILN